MGGKDFKFDTDTKKAEALKTACDDAEKLVCVYENKEYTNFVKNLKDDDAKVCPLVRKQDAAKCETMKIGNPKCTADCETISSASTLTAVVALTALTFFSL